MKKRKIKNKVKSIIKYKLGFLFEKLTSKTNFANDLKFFIDDANEFFSCVEEEFKIKLPVNKLIELKTVGQVVDYLFDKLR